MAADEKWYFTKEQLTNTPSRRCGIDADKELSYRQQAANFIQDMGQRLVVSQLCINTAIVYMHRFYVFHSLSHFHRNAIAAAALFLAAKVEEQPRKLEHVIRMAHMCLHRDQPLPDVRSEQYLEQAQDLVFNENVLLQTLGFDVAIDHPHTHVVRCCQLVKASKDLAQTSYFMASNSLHLTTMCLQYKPTVVACFCIHLACKWSNWEIPQSNEGKHWFWYVDKTVTSELLQQLTAEFLHIFDKCPSRLKRKIMSISATQSPSINHPSLPNSPFDAEPRKVQSPATPADGSGPTFHSNRISHHTEKQQEEKKQPIATIPRPPVDYREYREKKERERLEREKAAPAVAPQAHMVEAKHHSHHQKPVTTGNVQTKHPIPVGQKTAMHHNHHHRPELKVGQTVSQRHTGQQSQPTQASQQREPSQQRDQRQRLLHTHGHSHQKEEPMENPSHRADTLSEAAHGNIEKQSNNNHSVHRPVEKHLEKHMEKHQAHDKRMYDPRHKPVEHRKDAHKYQEPTGKYQQEATSKYPETATKYQEQPTKYQEARDRRKPELEQRCEEVRKLIEKPLPPPKPNLDPYSNKPHQKYSQSDKIQAGSCDVKAGLSSQSLAFPQEKSPSSLMQKVPKPVQNQHSAHGVPLMFKDTVKNGSQACLTSLSNIDDPKAEKRPREEEKMEPQQSQQLPLQQQQQSTPPGKQKSLFSPEKVTRESHSRPKTKQKTPPAKVPKQEISFVSPFASPPGSIQDPGCVTKQQETMPVKRSASDVSSSSHKRHRTGSSSGESGQTKIKIEDSSNFEAAKMLGRVPELIQPIRDNPTNGRATTEVKAELKPFESELRYAQPQNLTNGLDPGNVSKEQEMYIKKEPDFGKKEQEYMKKEHEFVKKEPYKQEIKTENKTEYLSPMKSAQSISALLQEPLAPMPSLLQQQYGQMTEMQQQPQQQQPQHHQQQQQQLLAPPPPPPPQPQSQPQPQLQPQSHQPQPMMPILLPEQQLIISEASVVSTVDISALSASVGSITDTVTSAPPSTTSSSVPASVPAPVEEKRSEHHKSEKKKKKEKHKHKDKEKNKEKHKHKHKDKDKERHREKEKEKEDVVPAVPIKITIPKDKLNLSSELTVNQGSVGAPQEKSKSPQNTSIKIIIPKERLKGADSSGSPGQTVVQGPLKIKIRTDGIRTATPASSTTSQTGQEYQESRKRERADSKESPTPIPPMKKQMPVYGQQQRPGERQNGRHYSGSNNKEKHTSSHHKSSSKFSQSQQSHAT